MTLRAVGTILCILLGVGVASGANQWLVTNRKAADDVEQAVAAGSGAELPRIAGRKGVDAWLVADLLCGRGSFAAAMAFSRAVSGPDFERLPAYVEALEASPTPKEKRGAWYDAIELLARRDLENGLRRLGEMEPFGDDVTSIMALGRLGVIARGPHRDLDGAQRIYIRAAESCDRIGWLQQASSMWHRAAAAAFQKRDLETAAAHWQRQLKIEERRRRAIGIGAIAVNLGLVYREIGNARRAVEQFAIARKHLSGTGDRRALGKLHLNECFLRVRLGDHRGALEASRRARALLRESGTKEEYGIALLSLGGVSAEVGAWQEALSAYEAAGKIFEEIDSPQRRGQLLMSLAGVLWRSGNRDRGVKTILEAVALFDNDAMRNDQLKSLAVLAGRYRYIGDAKRAREAVKKARAVDTPMLPAIDADLKTTETWIADRSGNLDLAAKLASESIGIARETGNPGQELRALTFLASIRGRQGKHEEAVRLVEHGAGLVRSTAYGLAHEHQANVRSRGAKLYDIGIEAAGRLDDHALSVRFLEMGRAGALLDGLGGEEAVSSARLGDEQNDERVRAKRRLATATKAYRAAMDGMERKVLRERRAAVEEARRAYERLLRRIDADARAIRGVVTEDLASFEEIRAVLGPEEAFVWLHALGEQTIAFTVLREGTPRIRRSKRGLLDGVAEAVSNRASDARAAAALRERLEDLVPLPDSVKRVIISPMGRLSYLPLGVLWPDREILATPSGTVFMRLRAARSKPGSSVLAVGDPVYSNRSAPARIRAGQFRLAPLPGTRKESKAVGDTVLLGKRATEAGFRAALTADEQGRWRAVHLACHGLVDPEFPMRSALALTASDADDGFLTAAEVMGLDLSTDLATLSACETGRGQVVAAEGILGLPSAFLVAGAPRVLVSLWKVDDEATSSLMVAFYKRFNPRDGTTPLTAAAALRAAQAEIRSDPRWSHPYFWGAWVLWGLP